MRRLPCEKQKLMEDLGKVVGGTKRARSILWKLAKAGTTYTYQGIVKATVEEVKKQT